MKKIIVIGSGGHAKVIIDIINCMGNYEIIGITSNSLEKGVTFCGFPVIGDDNVLANFNPNEHQIAMGLGGYTDNYLREKVYKYVKNLGLTFINIVHPSASISKTANLGEAVVIFPGVVLNTEVKVGNNSIVATCSSIDHETIIGDNVLVSAGVTIGAYSIIHDNALIALGAKIISGVEIGKNALVAAGAVVIKNVEADQRVFGIPAKISK